MISLKLCRNILTRLVVVLALISSLLVPPGFCQESEDSQVFISGFNAYQQKDYAGAIVKMNEVLQKYPDTPLRDMAIFWLARAYYKTGNQQEAARLMSQFSREYPDNPLRGTVEEELLALTSRYEKGEKLPTVTTQQATSPPQAAAQKAKAEKEHLAKEQAEREQLARKLADQERQATLKAEQERTAAAKAEEARVAAAAAAEAARLATMKAESERKAAEKTEQLRLAAQKVEQERTAAAADESARQLALKQEQERVELARAAQERQTQAKAEQQRLTQLKIEQDRTAAEKAEKERLAAMAAEKARLAAVQQEQERMAAAKAAAQAEAARLATAKQEQERIAAEKAAARSEEQRLAEQRESSEKIRSAKTALREKAIAEYKAIIEKYPNSSAATTAAAKLKELGIAVALPAKVAATETRPAEQRENTQVLRFEVAQFAGFEFNLLAYPHSFDVARRISVPFEVINRGNGSDSFSLDSGFPPEFSAKFAATATPDQNITQTPVLAPGESFKGVVSLIIPASSIDGLRISHPLKAASRLMPEASQSREVNLVASAPLLRAVLKTDNTQPLPGEKVVYRIAALNVGSTAGQDITLRLNFPPQLEPVDYAAAGFRADSRSLVLDGLRINSGESKEFTVSFQLKKDSLAGQELLSHADLINNPLKTSASFVSNVARVKLTRGILVKTGSERILAIPGQTFSVPFVVTNTGNAREKFKINPTVKGAKTVAVFHDLNRDGIKQANEPLITEIGPLEPQEEASVVAEVTTERNAPDRLEGTIQVVFSSDSDASQTGTASTRLYYSRPVLQMAMAGHGGRLKPGEVASFDLTISNQGSNLARVVELQSSWPEQLELIAAEPTNTSVNAGNILWKFKELGAGEMRTIKVSFRVKAGTTVGTNIQVTNIMKYEDQLGNRY